MTSQKIQKGIFPYRNKFNSIFQFLSLGSMSTTQNSSRREVPDIFDGLRAWWDDLPLFSK